MTVSAPTTTELIEAGAELGWDLSEADAEEYLGFMGRMIKAYELVDSLPDHLPQVKYDRTPGHQPSAADNPYNAWYYRTSITGAPNGKLKGRTVVLKDNICLAGVPLLNGSPIMEGYIPDVDATVAERVLDAGGEIVGKAHCEAYCYSGGSHTNVTGDVINPWKDGYSAGGSSSGCAVLVAAGEVDMAIGCDQAGSIRIPASFCGIYGMKPTHGLVPYTGIMASEATYDHVGPMTATVADNALLLEAIAGADGLDPRQYAPPTAAYSDGLDGNIKGLRIAVLDEGFGHPNAEPDVETAVHRAIEVLAGLGATVERVSIPIHRISGLIRTPIALEGSLNMLLRGNGFGTGWKGLYVTSLLDRHATWRDRAEDLPEPMKYIMLLGQHMSTKYRGHYYAKAQNLARRMTAEYDEAMAGYDVIVMPTLPIKATRLPPRDAPRTEVIARAHEMMANTVASTVTGHPSLSIPCGLSEGLPIGLMIQAGHHEEARIYKIAHAFEQACDWKTL